MISCDSNVLLYSLNEDCAEHAAAWRFVDSCKDRRDFVISELVLAELYILLRNPLLVRSPLDSRGAVELVSQYREHPHWRLVEHGTPVMDVVWKDAAKPGFPRRAIFDARLARTLQEHGVREFATRNVKDFERFGFERVFNPID